MGTPAPLYDQIFNPANTRTTFSRLINSRRLSEGQAPASAGTTAEEPPQSRRMTATSARHTPGLAWRVTWSPPNAHPYTRHHSHLAEFL